VRSLKVTARLLLLALGVLWVLYSAAPSLISSVALRGNGSHSNDDTVVYGCALMMREGHYDLYAPGKVEAFLAGTALFPTLTPTGPSSKATYPPLFYESFIPLTFLPISLFTQVWLACNCVFLILSSFFLAHSLRLCFPTFQECGLRLEAGVLALVLMSCPTVENVFQGQPNLMILCLLTASLYADLSGRSGWAGVSLGVATAIKIFPLALAAHFVCRRDRRALSTFAMTLAASAFLSLFLVGDATLNYVEVGLPTFSRVFPSLQFPYNRTLDGLLNHFHLRAWADALRLVKVGVVIASFWVGHGLWRRSSGLLGQCASYLLWLATTLLIMPSSWQYYDIYFLPVLIIGGAAAVLGPKPSGALQLGFGLSWVFTASLDTSFMLPWRNGLNHMRIAVVEWPGAVALKPLLFLLTLVLCLRLRKSAQSQE
jgi:hypothetical protein